MDYVVAARFTQPTQRLIAACNNWILLDTGIEICAQIHQSYAWKKPRRLVIVRQTIKDRTKALDKQLGLFAEEEIYKNYRYSTYVTNLKLAPAENRIKELKYDFGFDSFNLKDFYATKAMIAYNLIALSRTFVRLEKTKKTLSTLRYRTFVIGTYLQKINDKLVLK